MPGVGSSTPPPVVEEGAAGVQVTPQMAQKQVKCAVCNVQCKVRIVQCAVCKCCVMCPVYNVQICSVQYVMCSC